MGELKETQKYEESSGSQCAITSVNHVNPRHSRFIYSPLPIAPGFFLNVGLLAHHLYKIQCVLFRYKVEVLG